MDSLKLVLNIYPRDFNILANYSCLHRIVRTLVLVFIAGLVLMVLKLPQPGATLIGLGIILGGAYVSDHIFRKKYADWPHPSKFNGKITFTADGFTVDSSDNTTQYSLSDCVELVFFSDHFAGYLYSSRDLQRNGNALLFYKLKNETTGIVKFNLDTKLAYETFLELKEKYKNQVPYYKEYGTPELYHILKTDLTDRIKYH